MDPSPGAALGKPPPRWVWARGGPWCAGLDPGQPRQDPGPWPGCRGERRRCLPAQDTCVGPRPALPLGSALAVRGGPEGAGPGWMGGGGWGLPGRGRPESWPESPGRSGGWGPGAVLAVCTHPETLRRPLLPPSLPPSLPLPGALRALQLRPWSEAGVLRSQSRGGEAACQSVVQARCVLRAWGRGLAHPTPEGTPRPPTPTRPRSQAWELGVWVGWASP